MKKRVIWPAALWMSLFASGLAAEVRVVGDIGNPPALVLEGTNTFTPDEVSQALLADLDIANAIHPTAPLNELLECKGVRTILWTAAWWSVIVTFICSSGPGAASACAFGYNGDGQVTSVTSTADYNQLSGPRADVLTGAFSYETAIRLTGLAYTSNGGANTIDTLRCGWHVHLPARCRRQPDGRHHLPTPVARSLMKPRSVSITLFQPTWIARSWPAAALQRIG